MKGLGYERIERCRVSDSKNLLTVLSLGEQAFTGIFPKSVDEEVPTGPLELVWCPDSGLLQLAHRFDEAAMYGDNYGYRSGLNTSMVRHLERKAQFLTELAGLQPGDRVLDIGSNDGTLLGAYETPGLRRLGIDPTGAKFKEFYAEGVELVPTFFSRAAFTDAVGDERAKLITSIAMFYDLHDPIGFARDVHDCLADDGVWHFEQSYLAAMLRANAYDTICHEHATYYSLTVLQRVLREADLQIIDVRMNAVNGGSFAISATKRAHPDAQVSPVIDWILADERRLGLHSPAVFRAFEERVFDHRQRLVDLVRSINAAGKTILGYGASTKGNVLLQFCGFTPDDIKCIAEINPDKFGRVTPGTHIPIVSEDEANAMRPDYYLVLPWHFRPGIVERSAAFFAQGGRMIFPLPEIEIV